MREPVLTAEAGAARLDIVVGDITALDVDAVVNAATALCWAAARPAKPS